MISEEYADFTQHKFGPGTLRELATKLYRSPIAVYREAVSNAIDAMTPYEKEETKVEIFTGVAPDGDIVIEDYGTGIENYDAFTTISQGQKVVRDQVSSYQNVNEKIIGQKGMGKLSFLALSRK
jgi:HSP90 family molecular chaperone